MLRTKLSQMLKDAMRAKDQPVVSTLRLISAAIKDRDIAVRAVALGRDSQTPVGEIMTADVKYCFDDDDAAANTKA